MGASKSKEDSNPVENTETLIKNINVEGSLRIQNSDITYMLFFIAALLALLALLKIVILIYNYHSKKNI